MFQLKATQVEDIPSRWRVDVLPGCGYVSLCVTHGVRSPREHPLIVDTSKGIRRMFFQAKTLMEYHIQAIVTQKARTLSYLFFYPFIVVPILPSSSNLFRSCQRNALGPSANSFPPSPLGLQLMSRIRPGRP